MTKAEFLAILDKHLAGTATEDERRLLDDFYRHHLTQSQEQWALTDKERIRIEVLSSLNQAIDEDVQHHRWARFRSMWRVAASVALLIGAGLWLYLAHIAPAEIQYLTKATQRGEKTTLSLPDGTVVQLNAESSITFPEKFTDTRNVRLTGEAFFHVVRDETKPFIIRSGNLMTTVLGTSFNISAYPEDHTISVTVATGKVKIEDAGVQHQKPGSELLTLGEQGLFDKRSTRIIKTKVDLEKHLAWKEGTILLEDATLEEAVKILGRWYNAEFVFENPGLKKCTLNGKFKNDQLINILENLRFLMGIEYRVEPGNKIILKGESCR